MKTYTLSFADALAHQPEHPDRTAYRPGAWDYTFRVWPSRGAMLTTLAMQSRRAPQRLDWRDWTQSRMARATS